MNLPNLKNLQEYYSFLSSHQHIISVTPSRSLTMQSKGAPQNVFSDPITVEDSNGSLANRNITLIDPVDQLKLSLSHDILQLELRAKTLRDQVIGLAQPANSNINTNNTNSQALANLKSQANVIASHLIQLKQRSYNNAEAIHSQKRRSHNVSNVSRDLSHELFHQQPWNYLHSGTKVVTLLSNVHETVATLADSNRSNAECWVPPASFERSTHKYWISPQNVVDVMLKCIQEVPILTYGKLYYVHVN